MVRYSLATLLALSLSGSFPKSYLLVTRHLSSWPPSQKVSHNESLQTCLALIICFFLFTIKIWRYNLC